MLDLASPLDGFGSPFGARRGSFSPTSLFLNGGAGAWWGPPALSTYLSQDAPATTPVTAAGQAVGFIPDNSGALALGSEIITNGQFGTDTSGWTAAGSSVLTAPGGRLRVASGGSPGYARLDLSGLTVGQAYLLSGDLFTGTVAPIMYVGTSAGGNQYGSRTNSGSIIFIATQTTAYIALWSNSASAGVYAEYDNISLKPLAGNHARLSGTTSFRPVYQDTPQRLVFDATDDRLLSALNPTASGSIAARIRGSTVSRVALGSMAAVDGRCFLAMASDGSLGAGIGTQSTSVIKGSTDVTNTWVTGIVTWDGSTVNLYQNGASVYSAAQSGAVNTTVPFTLGSLNNNGTPASFWGNDIAAAIVLNRVMTPGEAISLSNYWSTLQ